MHAILNAGPDAHGATKVCASRLVARSRVTRMMRRFGLLGAVRGRGFKMTTIADCCRATLLDEGAIRRRQSEFKRQRTR